ncbi:MAG TPA: hypothetical protein VGA80_09570, partial [Flavobacteriaceae bacterium]
MEIDPKITITDWTVNITPTSFSPYLLINIGKEIMENTYPKMFIKNNHEKFLANLNPILLFKMVPNVNYPLSLFRYFIFLNFIIDIRISGIFQPIYFGKYKIENKILFFIVKLSLLAL